MLVSLEEDEAQGSLVCEEDQFGRDELLSKLESIVGTTNRVHTSEIYAVTADNLLKMILIVSYIIILTLPVLFDYILVIENTSKNTGFNYGRDWMWKDFAY